MRLRLATVAAALVHFTLAFAVALPIFLLAKLVRPLVRLARLASERR